MKPFNLSIPIVKVDEEAREVWGYATVEELDKQNEIVDYAASKKAFSAWPGNIREMHDPTRAIGKKIDVRFDDKNKGVWVGAKISRSTDGENAWIKIKEKVLQGFSIGGRVNRFEREVVKDADGEKEVNRIMDYDLSELSVVDNPAAPSAVLAMVKSVGGQLYEAEVLERAADPHPTDWWMKYFKISPDQLINKSDISDNENSIDKQDSSIVNEDLKITKSVYDAACLADLARELLFYINNEEFGGEDMGPLKNALKIITQEIADEVTEGDDFPEETAQAILLAERVTNLSKGSNMSKKVAVAEKSAEKLEKDLEKDMYSKRPGNAAAQSEVRPGTPINQEAEDNEAKPGDGDGANAAGPMSEAVGDRGGDSQPMYNVREQDGDTSVSDVRPEAETNVAAEDTAMDDHDYSEEDGLEPLLNLLYRLIGERRDNRRTSRPRVMSGGKPRIQSSAETQDLAKKVAEMLSDEDGETDSEAGLSKKLDTDTELSKVASDVASLTKTVGSLVEVVEKIALQPAAPKAQRFEVVEKSAEEKPDSEDELAQLEKRAEEIKDDTSIPHSERAELAQKLLKLKRARATQ